MIDLTPEQIADDEEYGCEYCQNDGRLNDNHCCPKCDAWYPEDEEESKP